MTHPHQLHAAAALWSLKAARAALDVHVYAAQRERGLALVETADGLHSQTFGNRHSLGGRPGDPTANAAVNGTTAASTSRMLTARAERLAASTTATLTWLARQLGAIGDGDPLERLQAAVPTLRPYLAERLALWVTEADQRVRQRLGLPADDYLMAEQLAARLTTAERPISADRIRDWARRSRRRGDKLHGMLPALCTPGQRTGNAWYRLTDGQRVLVATTPRKTQISDGAGNRAA